MNNVHTLQDLLVLLFTGGLLGLLGQVLRSVVGLKSLVDDAKSLDVGFSDLFRTARFLISFLLGFFSGVVAVLMIGTFPDPITLESILPIILAGYAGADFLEGFISRYISPAGSTVDAAIATKANKLNKASTPAPRPSVVGGARGIIYSLLGIPTGANPTTQDKRPLSDFGYNEVPSKQTLTDDVNHTLLTSGFPTSELLPPAVIPACNTVGDVINAVTKAIHQS